MVVVSNFTPLLAATNTADVKPPGAISVAKVEDLYTCLSEDRLAQEFKSFLAERASEDKQPSPRYVVKEVERYTRKFTIYRGYTAILTYDGVAYESLGIMVTRIQAEQSVAEVCLRSLGEFPQVDKNKYVVQAYKGGSLCSVPSGKVSKQPNVPLSDNKKMIKLLQTCTGFNKYHTPRYRYKEEIADGGERKMYKALVEVEGKIFETEQPVENMHIAKQQAALKALKFFKYPLDLGLKFVDIIKIGGYRELDYLGYQLSPLHYCPSKWSNWVSLHYKPMDVMTGVRLTHKTDTENKIMINNLLIEEDKDRFAENIVASLLNAEPKINSSGINELEDLYVCRTNKERKNDTLVGNCKFSIPMFCEEGRIMCTNTAAKVDLLPGQKLCGLKCSYEVMYPSLRIYLKAESCEHLIDSGPHPVLASCGVAVLLHDHEAESEDVHVLLTRSSKRTFLIQAKHLARYLNNEIAGSQNNLLNVAKFISNITKWNIEDLRLISEMTKESIREMMSFYINFDDRWNEVITKVDNEVLTELKTAALGELTQRIKENIGEEVDEENSWCMPSSPFKHKLTNFGATMENPLHCTYRSLLHNTGLRVKLSELETSPFIDVPVKDHDITDDLTTHSGDFCRYHIWRGLRKVRGDEEEPYYKPRNILSEYDLWIRQDEHDYPKRNRKRKMQEGNASINVEEDVEGGNKVVEASIIKDEIRNIGQENEVKGIGDGCLDAILKNRKQSDYIPRPHQMAVHTECKWFTLSEAISLCPPLAELSKDAIFREEVRSLIDEADCRRKNDLT